MHRDAVDLRRVQEQQDTVVLRFLDAGTPLPKSRHDAEAFATKYAEFASPVERLMAYRGRGPAP